MRQTFKAKDEDTLWQLETELRGLGFKWNTVGNSGKDSHVKKILENMTRCLRTFTFTQETAR